MADKYISQIAGYYLLNFTINRTDPMAIVEHEYPFSKRNSIQNNGAKTRVYAVECVFMDDYPIVKGWDNAIAVFPSYNQHKNFLETIASSIESFDFTHPVYGEMSGYIKNISSITDDSINSVNISFEFHEEIDSDEVKLVQYPVAKQAKEFKESTSFVTKLMDAAGNAAKSAVEFQGKMALYKGKLDSFLNKVTNPAVSITNTMTYASDVSGETMQSVNKAVDRVVESLETVRDTPATFINNLVLGVRELANEFTGDEYNYVFIMGSSRAAYEAAVVYTEDDEKQNKIKNIEDAETFDAAGNYLGTPDPVIVMTQQELDNTLYLIRELINEAILIDRELQELKNQAKDLQRYINQVKLNRDILETQEIPLQSLFTVAQSNGKSYQSVERILSLNPDIKNPTFTEGNVKVIVKQ